MSLKRVVVDNEESVVSNMCDIIEKAAEKAISERDRFIIAVSGGSVVNMLVKGLPGIKTCWPKWRVVFCDERLVPADDKESTFGLYKTHLIPATPLKEEQIIPIDFSLASNPVENAKKAALDYENQLKQVFPESSIIRDSERGKEYPRLDCAILGMGPDGHTCSLFPGDAASLKADSWVIPITNSPKPPPCRVTLTVPVLEHARIIIFPMAGSSKASTIKAVLDDCNHDLPATLAKPVNGEVHWIMDSLAASELTTSRNA